MTNEEKQLLLKDLCGRLPFGVKVNIWEYWDAEKLVGLDINRQTFSLEHSVGQPIFSRHNDLIIKPYLRPMSSMTEEEREEFENLLEGIVDGVERWDKPDLCEEYDWLNAHHFDYRGLIEKGLALEAPEGIYKTE